MQDTHPKIHDVDSREWKEEAQRIERGILKPSAQVIKVDDTSKTRDMEEGGKEGIFLHDGIVEHFVPRRQRGQMARMDSIEDEKAEVSKENDALLERMSAEQIREMQEEVEETLTTETMAWFRRRRQ
jgi:RPAP1-like protein